MNLTDYSPSQDLWQYLAQANKSIVMYGMGNGADKILDVCEKYGVEVCDFFASDGFVRGHSFHGKRVLSYSEAKQKYGADNMIVLLSFATCLPDVLRNITHIAGECELYAPDVPVCGETLFTLDFAREHSQEIRAAFELLRDVKSQRIFAHTIYYKLTGDIRYLLCSTSSKDEVYESLLDARTIKNYADLGAYNGDTIRELRAYSPALSDVVAFEPDRRSFRKLSEYCDTVSDLNIEKINAAAWNCDTVLTFGDEGNRNSGLFAKGKSIEVTATSLDNVIGQRSIDYVKYDVEGCEKEAIEGSNKTILRCKPRLLISAYHRSEDIYELPLMINRLYPDYRLYMRRYPYIPAWDLNLICI